MSGRPNIETQTQIPFAPEAEQALLGAVILDPEVYHQVAWVKPGMFYRATHRHVWESITRLAPHGIADWVTVIDDIVKHGGLTAAWSSRDELQAYIVEFTHATPGSEGVEVYAGLVRDAWQRRELGLACREFERRVGAGDCRGQQLVSELGGRLAALSGESGSSGPRPVAEFIAQAEEQRSRGGVVGIPSGFRALDEAIGGFAPGRLIVVGARPKQGKSSLLALFAAHVIDQAPDVPVLFFSLEMSGKEVAQKLICMRAGVDSARYTTGKLDAWDQKKAESAAKEIRGQLWIDETPRLSIDEIALRSRAFAAKQGGVGLLVVDYLGLAGGSDDARRGRNRYEEVGEVSRGLKILGKELGCPVLAAHQLRRESEDKDAPPAMRDLRESGNIEQDADQVLLLWPYLKDPETKETIDPHAAIRPVHLIVAGNRHGPTTIVKLKFHKSCTKFTEDGTFATPAITKDEAKRMFASPTQPLPGDD